MTRDLQPRFEFQQFDPFIRFLGAENQSNRFLLLRSHLVLSRTTDVSGSYQRTTRITDPAAVVADIERKRYRPGSVHPFRSAIVSFLKRVDQATDAVV